MNVAGDLNIVILGATGAVGSEVIRSLSNMPQVAKITALTRRPLTGLSSDKIDTQIVDPLNPHSYQHLLSGHSIAICTLGVGAPSKVSRQDFLKVDRDAVIDFGRSCKDAGVLHFQLLSSVGVSPTSKIFMMRSKGELEEALKAMRFERLSLFHPSNIITPTNRYGLGQALVLAVWPRLNPLLSGPLRKYRGIKVAQLGNAFAQNILTSGEGVAVLEWDAFQRLNGL